MPNAPSPPAAGSAAPKTSRRNFLVATASSAALPAVSRVASAKTVRAQDPRHASAPVGLALRVNGNEHLVALDIRTTLLDALREHLGLTGSKKG
jgi:xanthine dehydrogenase YagT iron-sulfur-binding subunit